MTELTTKDSLVRVQVYPHEACILINRPDGLIVLCFCGGAKSIILHVQQSEARIPPLRQCTCHLTPVEMTGEEEELSTPEDNMWTNGGKVEHLYAHLKREGE